MAKQNEVENSNKKQKISDNKNRIEKKNTFCKLMMKMQNSVQNKRRRGKVQKYYPGKIPW